MRKNLRKIQSGKCESSCSSYTARLRQIETTLLESEQASYPGFSKTEASCTVRYPDDLIILANGNDPVNQYMVRDGKRVVQIYWAAVRRDQEDARPKMC
jgi:hypothetical protein